MTPIETFEYKQLWKPGFTVRLHSDVVDKGKTFSKRMCERHQWSVTTWTANYEHTFHFEHNNHAEEFKTAMAPYADQ